jgi:hypothetical protein
MEFDCTQQFQVFYIKIKIPVFYCLTVFSNSNIAANTSVGVPFDSS